MAVRAVPAVHAVRAVCMIVSIICCSLPDIPEEGKHDLQKVGRNMLNWWLRRQLRFDATSNTS